MLGQPYCRGCRKSPDELEAYYTNPGWRPIVRDGNLFTASLTCPSLLQARASLMDKAEFVTVAPKYYSLAVIAYLYHHGGAAASQRQLSDHYHFRNDEVNEDFYYFERDKIFDIAIAVVEP